MGKSFFRALPLIMMVFFPLGHSDLCTHFDLYRGGASQTIVPPRCTSIDLSNTQMGDEALASLVEGLRRSPQVTRLLLQRNNIENCQALADLLPTSNITELHLSSNFVGDSGAMALSAALSDDRTRCKELHLANNGIGSIGSTQLARSLKHNAHLETLTLSYNNAVGDDFAISLSHALKSGCQLRDLHAVRTTIGNAGAAAFGDALSSNPPLQVLALDMSSVDDDGAVGLARGLQNTKHLRELRLGGMSARASESAAVDQDLSLQRIGDEGVRAIADSLRRGQGVLEVLDLSRGNVGDVGAAALAEYMKADSSLKILRLQDNKIGDEGARMLAHALQKHGVLEEMHLRHNSIHTEGGVAMLAALRSNPRMHQLVLYDNSVDAITQDRIRDLLHSDGASRLEVAAQERSIIHMEAPAPHESLQAVLEELERCEIGHTFASLCEEMGVQEAADLEAIEPGDLHASSMTARVRTELIECICASDLATIAHALCDDHREL